MSTVKKRSSGLKKKAKSFKKLGTAMKKKVYKKAASKVKRVFSKGPKSPLKKKVYKKAASPKKYKKSKSPKKSKRSGSPKKSKRSGSPKKSKRSGSPKKHKKSKKEAGKPKRALNAYLFFANENRAALRKQHPSSAVTDIARKLGKMWHSLSADDKVPYERMAARDKERASRERAAFIKSKGPKRPPSEFIKYSTGRRAELKEEHPDWDFGKISKEVGAEWRSMNPMKSEGKKHKKHHKKEEGEHKHHHHHHKKHDDDEEEMEDMEDDQRERYMDF